MIAPLQLFLDQQREQVITWQRELTTRPALGPESGGDGETAKAAWLAQELATMGMPNISHINSPDPRVPSGERPNIVALLPGKQKKTLWLVGHMDVVPAGETALWRTPPFTLHVEDDYVYGRGVEDNQQGIVSAMLAAKALLANKVEPELTLGLLFVADEETGMRHGLPHMLAANPGLIQPGDLVLVPDTGVADSSKIQIAEKSCLWLKFTINGKQCHASVPDQGINSLVVASACILALEELYRRFRDKNPLFSPSWSTFVPSKKEANVENINTIPGKDVFYMDCRLLPGHTPDAVLERCRSIVDEVAKNFNATVDIEVVHHLSGASATPQDAEVITRLQHSLQASLGITAKLYGAGGQTLASPLRALGIPAAVWATLEPNPHVPNERSSILHTIGDAKVFLHMLMNA